EFTKASHSASEAPAEPDAADVLRPADAPEPHWAASARWNRTARTPNVRCASRAMRASPGSTLSSLAAAISSTADPSTPEGCPGTDVVGVWTWRTATLQTITARSLESLSPFYPLIFWKHFGRWAIFKDDVEPAYLGVYRTGCLLGKSSAWRGGESG